MLVFALCQPFSFIFLKNNSCDQVNLFDDSTGNKYAEVAFESEMLALQAIKEFDGKEIIKKKVKIELVSNNKSTQSDEA